mmetsp:Transcript_38509/g.56607  ORF Transcript_38509/g.56607 Transcript_38509/m.56607 type:complete len:80 (-) Transcript_38509:187-426(-)
MNIQAAGVSKLLSKNCSNCSTSIYYGDYDDHHYSQSQKNKFDKQKDPSSKAGEYSNEQEVVAAAMPAAVVMLTMVVNRL